jgi:hypothetical protein
MGRRKFLKQFSQGAALAGLVCSAGKSVAAQPALKESNSPSGNRSPLKITNVKAILTAPARIRLCVVKVQTSEPGLYGVGCATFTQRIRTVATAVDQYLAPFLAGQDPDNIEDIWQAMFQSSYWRNGPVLMNALSGVDAALWESKASERPAGAPIARRECRGVPGSIAIQRQNARGRRGSSPKTYGRRRSLHPRASRSSRAGNLRRRIVRFRDERATEACS